MLQSYLQSRHTRQMPWKAVGNSAADGMSSVAMFQRRPSSFRAGMTSSQVPQNVLHRSRVCVPDVA